MDTNWLTFLSSNKACLVHWLTTQALHCSICTTIDWHFWVPIKLVLFTDLQHKLFTARYEQQSIDIYEFPIKLVLPPFTLALDIVGSAPRGFGVPELISKLSYASIFVKILKLYESFIILCHLCHVHCVGFCKVRDFIGCFSLNYSFT